MFSSNTVLSMRFTDLLCWGKVVIKYKERLTITKRNAALPAWISDLPWKENPVLQCLHFKKKRKTKKNYQTKHHKTIPPPACLLLLHAAEHPRHTHSVFYHGLARELRKYFIISFEVGCQDSSVMTFLTKNFKVCI